MGNLIDLDARRRDRELWLRDFIAEVPTQPVMIIWVPKHLPADPIAEAPTLVLNVPRLAPYIGGQYASVPLRLLELARKLQRCTDTVKGIFQHLKDLYTVEE